MKYESHELAELFPMMPESEIKDLAEDIKTNGMRHPVIIHEGKILDGRNRYAACKLVGIDPIEAPFKGKDALAYVLSANLTRRHLTTAQRAMVAAKLANMTEGRPNNSPNSASYQVSQSDAAKKLSVGVTSVKDAKAVIAASPEKAAAVVAGTISLNHATKEVKASKPPPPPKKREFPKDDNGKEIPNVLIPLWNRRGEVKVMINSLNEIKRNLKKSWEDKDPLYVGGSVGRAPLNYQSIAARLEMAIADLKAAYPVRVCPSCQGDTCRACCGLGLISDFYLSTIPESIRGK